jgi:MoCo/4Fe-4S cofactor protein with predicted Tat translocation signal
MNSRKNLGGELAQWQSRLGQGGRQYWQSLEELAESEAFAAVVRQEFPEQADVWPDALSRRQFLSVMAASLALGGISGCSVRPAPAEKIVPYARPQDGITPGRPLFFATTMTIGADAVGLLVESHMGRPTKIEGNPDHPASLGATNAFHQASILSLYDPDRSQTVTYEGQIRGWNDAEQALRQAILQQRAGGGAGLRILTETVVSPTLGQQLRDLLDALPSTRWHQYEPIHNDNGLSGASLAFGEKVDPVYDFTKAEVVLSLDADFLATGPGHLRYARDFMARRQLPDDEGEARRATMNRLYVVETAVTCTGAKSDHRLAVRGNDVEWIARAIAAELDIGQRGATAPDREIWIKAVAAELAAHRGHCLVVAGHRQPPVVHLLAHALNERLANIGQTVRYISPIAARSVECGASLQELIDDIRGGQVETLIILGGNPVYNTPADTQFAQLLSRVPLRFHLSLYADETSRRCQWHLPQAHYLESWSDARCFDGTASIVQPLIEPLYQGRSAHELLALLTNAETIAGDEIVRSYWRKNGPAEEEDAFAGWWQTALHDGVVADSAFETRSVHLRDGWQESLQQTSVVVASSTPSRDLEITFDADPTIFDGALANNGWLQELPKPLTKLTWDNAAIMSPRTAAEFDLKLGAFAHGGEHGGYRVPVVELRLNGRMVEAPIWIMPGHADGAVTVHFGYGRQAAGRVGGNERQRVGFDAYSLRPTSHPWFARGLSIVATGRTYDIACTQSHFALDGRDIVRSATLSEYRQNPRRWKEPAQNDHEEQQRAARSIYPSLDQGQPRHQWGMLIDLTACTGCSACVVACQAENNIPVVGKEQVLFGREMHWLRVDRYVSGAANAPESFHFQPLPCMHCEHAPCEYVCPVAATVHSADGLNDMVYNRCVGTRFCSNNCPYKVRRFNFLAYSDYGTPSRRLQYNPDVTVRTRGVMEKCTYCVQRIRAADMDAEAAQRPIRDGDVLTACQAVCPTQAIAFGNLNDADSQVARAKRSPLEYGLLAELNTFPRTTYLAEVRNPNPALEAS